MNGSTSETDTQGDSPLASAELTASGCVVASRNRHMTKKFEVLTDSLTERHRSNCGEMSERPPTPHRREQRRPSKILGHQPPATPVLAQRARVGFQVADALAYATAGFAPGHQARQRCSISRAVWVTDFGLAKAIEEDLTNTGDVLGTLRYMARAVHGAMRRSRRRV